VSRNAKSTRVLVFVAIPGAAPEIAINSLDSTKNDVHVVPGDPNDIRDEGGKKKKGNATTSITMEANGDSANGIFHVLRITPSTEIAATVTAGASILEIIVLPSNMSDRIWKTKFDGQDRVFISTDEEIEFVFADDGGDDALNTPIPLLLRANTSIHLPSSAPSSAGSVSGLDSQSSPPTSSMTIPSASMLMLPYTPLSTNALNALPAEKDGAFMRITVPFSPSPSLKVTWQCTKAAAPPRSLSKAPSGKTQEPTAADWELAAEWVLSLDYQGAGDVRPLIEPSDELRLAIRYRGDSARLYHGQTLLTDNWFSGYTGPGQMEVGLSYLSGEIPALLQSGTNLTLKILPLKRSDLESNIYVQPGHWPDFEGNDTILALDTVEILKLSSTSLVALSL